MKLNFGRRELGNHLGGYYYGIVADYVIYHIAIKLCPCC